MDNININLKHLVFEKHLHKLIKDQKKKVNEIQLLNK